MRLTIETLGQGGDGIADLDGERWYVPYTVPGDVIEAKPDTGGRKGGPNRALIQQLLEPGPDRIAASCRHFSRCGGCALQQLETGRLSEWKRQNLLETLQRRGFGDIDVQMALTGYAGRRRRATITARRGRKGGLTFGYHERRGKELISVEQCPLLVLELESLLGPLRDLTRGLLNQGEVRLQINLTDGGVDMLLDGQIEDTLAAHEAMVAFAEIHDLARISYAEGDQPRTIVQRRRPELRWQSLTVTAPPGAFLQADRDGEKAMQNLIGRWSAGVSKAVDLFAGVGTLSAMLPLERGSLAVDSDPAAMQALKQALDAAPGADMAVETRNLYRRPLMADELTRFDLAVLDPPAAGAKDQCEQLAASTISRVAYVSCAPGTFTRDARIMADAGFRISELHLIDQFHWSPEVELAALLERV